MEQESKSEEEVYKPAEDTFLLLKVTLKEAKSCDKAIEIGCGRALISREIADKVKCIIATDINPSALRIAKHYNIPTVMADLLRGFKAKFDLIIFNPPYLPTAPEEKSRKWINQALDGGENGRETIFRFLEQINENLSPKGRSLLLISSLSGMAEVKEKAIVEGLEISEMARARYFFEELYVIKIQIAKQKSNKYNAAKYIF
ncbi:MAG: methyltransferase [Methanotrichaceae archaeon]|nr:methyltransferase [Methanotrichaceae archaeon]